MTSPYSTTLSKTDSCQLDSSGNGLITLRPDMGQNWAPLFVRVSTASRVTPVAYCAVYHGSPGVPVQQSQFIDDTFTGSGDTSSMIAGTPVLFGEALLFQFQNGTPGDTAIATVFGQNSSLPPNLDLVPQVPGTHFAGHLSTEIISLLTSAGVAGVGVAQLITSGSSFTTQLVDVRQFGSYYLEFDVRTNLATTGHNQLQVDFAWQSDSNIVTPTTIFQDQIGVWADSAAAPVVSLGRVYAQDAMHGSYMQLTFTNNGPDTLRLTYQLMGTTRVLSGPYVRQGSFSDGILNTQQAAIPGGGSGLVLPLPILYGNTEFIVFNKSVNTMGMNLDYNMPGDDTVIQTIPANTLVVQQHLLPKTATLLVITGTIGDTVSTRIISQFNKS